MKRFGIKAGATAVSLMFSLVSLGGAVQAQSSVEVANAVTPGVTTEITRSAKMTKAEIIETSVKTETSSVVKKEKNAAASTKTTAGAATTVTSSKLVSVTSKTSVTVKKTATETITETKKVTTKVEKFPKAKSCRTFELQIRLSGRTYLHLQLRPGNCRWSIRTISDGQLFNFGSNEGDSRGWPSEVHW